MSSELKPKHGILLLKLINENEDVMLVTELQNHTYLRLPRAKEDADTAHICDSSSSNPCFAKSAYELGLIEDDKVYPKKLKLFYSVIYGDGPCLYKFNISRTENMDGAILDKPITVSRDDMRVGKVETSVRINSKSFKAVVENKGARECKCTPKLSSTHPIETKLIPVGVQLMEPPAQPSGPTVDRTV